MKNGFLLFKVDVEQFGIGTASVNHDFLVSMWTQEQNSGLIVRIIWR
jgi:hypothetical protein